MNATPSTVQAMLDSAAGPGYTVTLDGAPTRLGHRAFHAPSKSKDPLVESPVGDARNIRPLGYGLRFSTKLNEAIHPHIPALLTRNRPSAVLWRIVAIIVDAVDGVLRARWKSHVGKEVLERVSPTVADPDPAPTVVFPVGIRGVAPDPHSYPPAVDRRSAHAVGLLGEAVVQRKFSAKTPATLLSAAAQNGGGGNDGVSTIAPACPRSATVDRAPECLGNKSPEPAARDIFDRHDDPSVIVVTSLARVNKTRAGLRDCSRNGVLA